MALDLDAIRAKWLQVCGACDAGIGECSHPGEDYRPVILDLLAEVAALTADRDRLREHILDIDAHATPYGDIPDEPGLVGTYLVTAGALHRALGKIGHSAPSCEAELQRDYLLAERELQTAAVNGAAEGAKTLIAERDAALASLAEARKQTALRDAVVERVRLVIDHQRPGRIAGPSWQDRRDELWGSLTAAVDALDAGAATGGEEG